MDSSTTAIIVSYKSKWIIENCIKSIESNTRIIVVENSNDHKLKKSLEKRYSNLKVIINNNNGFGNGANVGALQAKTKYLLFLGPDTMLENKAINNITKIAKNFNDSFGAILPSEFKNRVNTISEIKKNPSLKTIDLVYDVDNRLFK
jgi:GT2 family glycosyltransferase